MLRIVSGTPLEPNCNCKRMLLDSILPLIVVSAGYIELQHIYVPGFPRVAR